MRCARFLSRVGACAIAVALGAGCARPALVADELYAGGVPATEFSVDDEAVTLIARFDSRLATDARFIVEWQFPDGRLYLRKPVRGDGADGIETSLPIRTKAPGRYPGVWRVRLLRGRERLVERSFAILESAQTARAAGAGFAAIAYCGPARWRDAAISGSHGPPAAPATPGAWIGSPLLDAAGATYSTAILLTGCAPG